MASAQVVPMDGSNFGFEQEGQAIIINGNTAWGSVRELQQDCRTAGMDFLTMARMVSMAKARDRNVAMA